MKNLEKHYTSKGILKFFLFSSIGIFMFFAQVSMDGKKTIPLDHIVTFIKTTLSGLVPFYVLIIVTVGAILPFYQKTWNKSPANIFFSVAKIIGAVLSFMVYFKAAPAWMLEADMGPSLYNTLLVSVGLIVPVGSIFLSFLTDYGLLEIFGVLLQPIMRPVFKTPGRSSLDAVASFVGSYSLGIMITNRLFKENKYSIQEAMIIVTGFSTVSVAFMIVIAKTLSLMEMWTFYFWTTLIITFAVTAITVRLYPIRKASTNYYSGEGDMEPDYKGNLIKIGFIEGFNVAEKSNSIWKKIASNVRDGLLMAANILPTGMSLAMAGMALSKYTPLFDWLGYIFMPFFKLFNIPDALLGGKAAALSIVECYIPAFVVTESALSTRYVVGVICVSAIVFFAATVPCILGTEIPVKVKDLVIIWLERVIFSTILAALVATLFVAV